MCRYEASMPVSMSHMKSLLSAMWPGVLAYMNFTLLASNPEQIIPLHCKYMFHCTSTVVYICTIQECTLTPKYKKIQLILNMLLPYTCQHKICPSKAIYMPNKQISSWAYLRQVCQCTCLIWHQQCDHNETLLE